MKLSDITIYSMHRPLGCGADPWFGWKIESDQPDTLQEACQITVADEAGQILWDTGRVASRKNAYLPYQGSPLQSRTRYQVTVNVWDNHGQEASLSSDFETALLHTSDWQAGWAESSLRKKKGKPGFGKQDPATMFRRAFSLKDTPAKARVYATCHGAYHLSVNGQRPDQREFAPEHTVYEKYLCYQTYDVTGLLQKGENVLGMYVGDGWYLCPQSLPDMKIKHAHAVLFQLEVTYADGTTETICSDSETTVSYGPILCSDLYAGESYDAIPEQPGWDTAGFSDNGWKKTVVASYSLANLVPQLGEPVLPAVTLPVKEVLHSPKGETILDFGQNLSGRVRMHVDAPKGTVITLEHCEVLDAEGNYFNNILGAGGVGKGCDQMDRYVSAGTPVVYEPHFTFHGFRYVKVSGLAQVNPEDFTAVALTSKKENAGTFSCSDERLNRLYENTRWSQRSNMMSIPTDCPQREKAGWTGDMLVYAKTAMLNEDCTTLFTRWLDNMSCDQDKYGIVPMVVPCDGSYPATGKMINLMSGCKGKATSSGWGDAAVAVPYAMYRVTGNTVILERQYDCMKKWCDYVITQARTRKPKHTQLPDEIENYLWDTGYHYGEWLIPSQNRNGMDMKNLQKIMAASSCYTAPIFGWYSVATFAKIASILGKTSDAEQYQQTADKMKTAFQKGVIREDGTMPSELMGAYVLPIYFDLVPQEHQQTFADHLVKLIRDNNNCLDTGFLATPFLLDALCKIGRRDLAYALLWQDKCPSWLFEVNHGATTIWESWYGYDEKGAPGQLSFNHYAFGCVDDWIFRNVAGIDTDTPGYTHLIFAPKPDEKLTSAARTFETAQGTASCQWEIRDNGSTFSMDVTVPCNATATVCLPNGQTEEAGSGSCHWEIALKA